MMVSKSKKFLFFIQNTIQKCKAYSIPAKLEKNFISNFYYSDKNLTQVNIICSHWSLNNTPSPSIRSFLCAFSISPKQPRNTYTIIILKNILIYIFIYKIQGQPPTRTINTALDRHLRTKKNKILPTTSNR